MDKFDVWQEFVDGEREKVRDKVSADEAMKAFHHYSTSVGAKLGTTKEVLIVDASDCTNAHWKYGEGLIFPTK